MYFDTIDYLKSGNTKQVLVYKILTEHKIMELLKSFNPILTGTIPIDIDIDSSDLDICCSFDDKNLFIQSLNTCFGKEKDFRLNEIKQRGIVSVIANFSLDDFEIEVFGQALPVKEQSAYRHMLIEDFILKREGEDFRQQIINLKKHGYKTEPAFCLLLDIPGDPYEELLKYKMP